VKNTGSNHMDKTDRRGFLKTSEGSGAHGLSVATGSQAARTLTAKDKIARIASNTWPIRHIFKSRTTYTQTQKSDELKKKYGEITMLDFSQFTKDTFPGVYHMDLFSGLFGDVADDSMYVQVPLTIGAANRTAHEFDRSSAAGRRWLDKLTANMTATGTKRQHISNNAPRDIFDLDPEKRKAGIEVANKWLNGSKILCAEFIR